MPVLCCAILCCLPRAPCLVSLQAGSSVGYEPPPPPPAAAAGQVVLGPGDCFSEVAFFTEVPKAEAVRSLTVCRVFVIPRRCVAVCVGGHSTAAAPAKWTGWEAWTDG